MISAFIQNKKSAGLSRQKMTGVCFIPNTCDYRVPSHKRIFTGGGGKSKVIFYSKMKTRIFNNRFKLYQTEESFKMPASRQLYLMPVQK